MPGFDPFAVFLSAFGVSTFAGLAAALRPGKPLGWLAIVSSMLNSGLLGLAIALIWYTQFRDANNVYLLIGICLVAGLGGNSVTEFLLYVVKKGGIIVNISHKEDEHKPPSDQGGAP